MAGWKSPVKFTVTAPNGFRWQSNQTFELEEFASNA
jgi:hypothetical protein